MLSKKAETSWYLNSYPRKKVFSVTSSHRYVFFSLFFLKKKRESTRSSHSRQLFCFIRDRALFSFRSNRHPSFLLHFIPPPSFRSHNYTQYFYYSKTDSIDVIKYFPQSLRCCNYYFRTRYLPFYSSLRPMGWDSWVLQRLPYSISCPQLPGAPRPGSLRAVLSSSWSMTFNLT